MTSQAGHVTPNVPSSKFDQYLTLVKLLGNSINQLQRNRANKIGGKKKNKKNNKNSKKYKR